MSLENWSQNHKTVFNAFEQILPKEKELSSLEYSLNFQSYNDHAKKRQARRDYYATIQFDLKQALGSDMDTLLIDYFVNPTKHSLRFQYNASNSGYYINNVAMMMIQTHCEQQPSQLFADAISARFVDMFKRPIDAPEVEANTYNTWNNKYYSNHDLVKRYYPPNARDCLRVLSKHLEFDGVMSTVSEILQGKYNQRVNFPCQFDDYYVETSEVLLSGSEDEFIHFMQVLFSKNQFTYEWFKNAHSINPKYGKNHWAFPQHIDRMYQSLDDLSPEFLAIYQEFYTRFIIEVSTELPNTAETLGNILNGAEISGINWLDTGMSLIKTHKLKAKDLKDEYDDLAKCIRTLIDSYGLNANESHEQLIEMLATYSERELLVALPYAGCAREAILSALGWETLIPLQRQLFKLGEKSWNTHDDVYDVENSEDPMSGVIDRSEWQEILKSVDEKHAVKYIKALRASSMSFSNLLMLVCAVMGLEKDKIEKKLVRHGQGAMKAYGLYAIENENELRERYIKFKTMYKEASQYGHERQTNTRAAAKAGIKNLAQTAGYTDDTRLEWAMEADIANTMLPFNTDYPVDAWTARFVLEGITPKIRISKQGKPLKSVPAKVRKSDVYQQMRDAQDTVREQARRFKKTLEDMMCASETIHLDELATLSRLPIVSTMLSQLVLKTPDNQFGLFNGNTESLVGIDGKLIPITDALTLAHVYDLFSAGVLSNWQRAIVKRRIVQPFKQVFRELYIVTPAEIEAKTHSRRFAGHYIDGAIASRLLQARTWNQLYDGASVDVYKRFPQHNLVAQIGFPDSRHYLAEDDTTVDEIWFTDENKAVNLDQVDPLVFSEVMRDADLLVSVAQIDDGHAAWSKESAERRAELVLNLMQDIGLTQVTCEGHYAFIEGKLASYRIHLGSGVIHIQPGNYLCIVPEQKQDDDLYLPFADVDKRMAEIISKVFLLINDDQITDESILSQITQPTETTE